MHTKIPDLAMAVECRFGDHHGLMCRLHLRQLRISRVTALRQAPQGQPAPAVHPSGMRLGRSPPRRLPGSLYHRHMMKCGGYRSPLAEKKAIVVVAHALLVVSHILATGKPYHELGHDYFTRRLDPERETRRLMARLEALGHPVTLDAAA